MRGSTHSTYASFEARAHEFHRAIYVDGEMAPGPKGSGVDPKPCAGNDGTTVTVCYGVVCFAAQTGNTRVYAGGELVL